MFDHVSIGVRDVTRTKRFYDAALKPLLKPQSKDAKPVDYVILVPASFGKSPLVRLWSNRQPSPQFAAMLQDVLTRDLRTRYLASQGMSPAAARTRGPRAGLSVSTWSTWTIRDRVRSKFGWRRPASVIPTCPG